MSKYSKILTVEEFTPLARRRIPRVFFDYIRSGSWTEQTLASNKDDLRKLRFHQRVGRNLATLDVSTKLLGRPVDMPVILAPCGMGGCFRPDGELHARRAAKNKGVEYTLSTMSIASLEDVSSLAGPDFFFQLYVMKDKDYVKAAIARAKKAGCKVLVLTLDLQMLGQRHADIRNGLGIPPKATVSNILDICAHPAWALGMLATPRKFFGNLIGHVKDTEDVSSLIDWIQNQFERALSWQDVQDIKQEWGGPMVVKGIMHPEDALKAVDNGADAVVVSNHGGRQLDGALSSIVVLPSIAKALKGTNCEVWMDSGITSGQDILKARALGAKGVMIGRSYLYPLAAGGQQGVERALDIMKKELEVTMGFCGVNHIDDVDESILANPYV
ncbi:L-lactate dehydrogenase [Diplonema papillatum]|nr:L-lactate dehydrogenase [Diplonema papillatum]|eukprot:gene6272-9614_t